MFSTTMGFVGFTGFGVLFFVLMLWNLFWKAWALWIAARRGEKIWFGVMLVVNTVGILEILYIYVFSKDKNQERVKNMVGNIMTNAPVVEGEFEEKKTEEPKTEDKKTEEQK